jgi:hypothetical protein
MTTIESKVTTINKRAADVYLFLEDLNNHQQLMPDSIYNWSSTKDEAKFTIKDMAKLELMVSERIPNSVIKIVPKVPAPFPIDLQWEVKENGDHADVRLIINADMNPFIKMMAVGPLQKLVDHQTEKLKELMANS